MALLSACATTTVYPAPTVGQFAAVDGAVNEARARGVAQDPAAVQHLRLAEMQLAEAKQHIAAGDNRGASLLLARADADAELSQMLQRQTEATAEARTTETELRETQAQTPVQPRPGQP